MRNHANVFTLIVVATTLLVLGGTPGFGAAQQKVVTWKYMGNEIVNTPQLGLMTEFGAKITEATGGRVKVTTYGHDELPYKATDTMKVLNDNLVQIAQMPHVWSVGDIPVVVVTDLPFLARTKQQQDKYYATIEPFVAAAFEKRFNVKAIAYVDYDRRQIVSRVPTRSLRDLKGQKIRAAGGMEPLIINQVLGATAVTVPFSEAYSALSTGIVDAIMTGSAAHEQIRSYEPGEYMLKIDGHVTAVTTLVNRDAFRSISEKDQQTILALAKEFRDKWNQKVTVEWSEGATARMLAVPNGLKEATALTQDEWLELQKRTIPIIRKYIAEKAGPEGTNAFEAILKVLDIKH